MIAILSVVVLGILAGLSIAAVLRDRKRKAVEAFATDLRERRKLEAMYVSRLDRSFVAFRFSDRTLVVGDGKDEREYPFSSIRGVELVRQETADRSGGFENGWTKRLAVRISLDDPERPEHLYSILDWPRGKGLPTASPQAQVMWGQAERLHAQVVEAMGRPE